MPPPPRQLSAAALQSIAGLEDGLEGIIGHYGMTGALTEALELRQSVINALPCHIALLDGDGVIVHVNGPWRQFAEQNDYDGASFGLGCNYLELCRNASGNCAEEAPEVAAGLQAVLDGEGETFALEYPCHAPGEKRWFCMMARRLAPGEHALAGRGAVVMHVDITARKLAELEVNSLAYEDPLTGQRNRQGFLRALGDALRLSRGQLPDMVVALDIDGLRDIFEAHGPTVGSRLLVAIARRLAETFGPQALVGRIREARFALYLGAADAAGAAQRRARLAQLFQSPFDIDGMLLDVPARFGFTVLGGQSRTVEALLQEAEMALSESRRQKRREGVAYSAELEAQRCQRTALTRELRVALQEGQFQLHFEPKVALTSGAVVGCEALLRWPHPERGLQGPEDFLAAAEQSRLILPLGDWVLEESCRRMRQWQDAGLKPVPVSVSVSPTQLHQHDFARKVEQVLQRHGIAASSLVLEIPERAFTEASAELLQQLEALRAVGTGILLDGFGTVYSSLRYLQQCRFDEIRIDRDVVSGALREPFGRNIVAMVVALARLSGARTVVEGVDGAETRDALIALGCDLGQGTCYSAALSAGDFPALLEQHAPFRAAWPPADRA